VSLVRRWPHPLWAALGAVSAACMWYAWSLPGGIGMFVCIGLAFLMWHRLGSRGSWLALIVVGVAMSSVLGWQAVTGSRCPHGDDKVFLRADRAPIGCTDVRASAAVMSAFFGIIALIGIAAPLYARSMDDEPDDLLDDTPAAG
jgi:hypothetical protein